MEKIIVQVLDPGQKIYNIKKINLEGGITMAGLSKKELEALIGHSVDWNDNLGDE